MSTIQGPSPTDQITFLDAHRPALRAGEYVLTATLTQTAAQAAAVDGQVHTAAVELATQTTHLYVGAERFRLRKEDIHACHPAPGASGNFRGRLPHVVFQRSTLPWERNPNTKPHLVESPPWLALLLFRDAEAPAITNVKFSNLMATTTRGPALLNGSLTVEPAQEPDEPVSVIDVPNATLQRLLPTWSELPLTAHARRVQHADGTSETLAVLLGTRVIEASSQGSPTAWVAHLVSLEECFEPQGATYVPGDLASAGKTRVISLHHWQFVDHELCDFGSTVGDCDGIRHPASFRLTGPLDANGSFPPVVLASEDEPTAIAAANRLLAAGSAPLPYRLRSGDQTVGWFRGPLVAALAGDGFVAQLPLPVFSGDELVIFDQSTGMFDVSYAVAWELGRLEALADARFAEALSQWKRARAQRAARLRVEADSAFLPHAAARPGLADFPTVAADFLTALGRLSGLPPAHLLPHGGLLPLARSGAGRPVGSFRFFEVDPQWVECLVDGAMSVGRVTGGDRVRDAQHLRSQPVRATMKGFLLRSQVVADYPDLAFDGFATAVDSVDGGARLTPLTVRRLAPDTLFVLFDTDALEQVDLHLPAESMHFGFAGESDAYTVNLRAHDTGAELRDTSDAYVTYTLSSTGDFDGELGLRRVRLDQLAAHIASKLTNPPADFATHAHAAALQLLDGPVRIRIRRQEQGTP